MDRFNLRKSQHRKFCLSSGFSGGDPNPIHHFDNLFKLLTSSSVRRQKQGLQVIQEIKATHGGFDTQQVALDQTLTLGQSQIIFNCTQRQTSALKKLLQRKPVFQTQGVEHELKRQVRTADLPLL